jgi:hypothetical protein
MMAEGGGNGETRKLHCMVVFHAHAVSIQISFSMLYLMHLWTRYGLVVSELSRMSISLCRQ